LIFVEKHKALLFTSLITGTIVLGLFSFSITNKTELITESYFEIEPQTEDELKTLQELKELEAKEQANTNEASNQDALNEEERERFNKAKDILAQQTAKTSKKHTPSSANSSVSFSLKNRQKVTLLPPVYLCETGGKIVVNITVNSQGHVTDAYINTSSSSNNQCLIDTAIEYAENAIFSNADRKIQIGSITYYFKSK